MPGDHNASKAARDSTRLGTELVTANDALRLFDTIVGA